MIRKLGIAAGLGLILLLNGCAGLHFDPHAAPPPPSGSVADG